MRMAMNESTHETVACEQNNDASFMMIAVAAGAALARNTPSVVASKLAQQARPPR